MEVKFIKVKVPVEPLEFIFIQKQFPTTCFLTVFIKLEQPLDLLPAHTDTSQGTKNVVFAEVLAYFKLPLKTHMSGKQTLMNL